MGRLIARYWTYNQRVFISRFARPGLHESFHGLGFLAESNRHSYKGEGRQAYPRNVK